MSCHLLHLILLLQTCLVFSQTPSFTTNPLSQTILQHGNAAILSCSASSATSYIWRKDGVTLSNSSMYTVISNTLQIPSVSPAQEGAYTCLASNSASMTTVSSAIANMRTSVFSIASTTGSEVMVDRNGAVTFPCGAITAHPLSEVSYAWEYNIGFGFVDVSTSSPNKPVVGDDGTLYITNATKTARYRCRASFGIIYTPLQYFVNVTVSETVASPPTSTVLYGPTDLTVNQGDNAVLECIGVVGGAITWAYPSTIVDANRVQPADTKLNLFNVDSSFEGSYTCTVTFSPDTGMSTAMLTVIVPPTMTNNLEAATAVNFGTALGITCTASGRGITWLWYHNGEPIIPSATDASDPLSSTSTFSIGATAKADAGAYQCFAYNSAGSAQDATTVTITVVPPTITTPLTEAVAFFGSSITMTCAATGFPPPTFTWDKAGVPITIPGSAGGVLTIPNVGPLFPGMYTCTATAMIPGDSEVIPSDMSSAEFFAAESTVFTTTLPSALTVSTGKGFALECAATHSADTTVVLTWSRDAVALEHGGSISLTPTSDSTSISLALNVVQTTLGDAGMYSCSAVTTYTAGGKSIATTPIDPITTPIDITDDPIVPQITELLVNDARSISISWLYTGVISDITGYEVEYRARGENYTKIERSLDSVTQVTFNNLRTFTEYSIRVAAVHTSDGSRSYSAVSVVQTPQTAPTGPPLRLSATTPRDQNTTLFIHWEHPVERERNGIITGYTIRYWANITRDPAIPLFKFEVKLRTNATTLTLTELTPETEYFVEVAANTTVGMGPYSDFVTGSTLIRDALLPQTQFYQTIWFIALCVLLIISCVLSCGCVMVILRCRRKRKSGKFSVRHSGYFAPPVDNLSMADDVVADYENRKKDFPSPAFVEGVDNVESETSMSTAGTKFTYPPSNASFTLAQRMPPPGYIEPPSFEATLRARSASMSALEKHMIGSTVLPQPLTSSHTYIPTGLEDKNSRDSDDSGHHSSHSPDFATFV